MRNNKGLPSKRRIRTKEEIECILRSELGLLYYVVDTQKLVDKLTKIIIEMS